MRKIIKEITSKEINTIDDVKTFIKACVDLGLLFHPDNRFSDYINKDGSDFFAEPEAMALEALLNRADEICDNNNVDIYQISLSIFNAKMDSNAK